MVNFDTQLMSLKEELLSMSQELHRTVARTNALEERLSAVEDMLFPLQGELKGLQELTDLQAAKLDAMENRLRRNSVRVVGLPEQCEGTNPTIFMENWCREIFGSDSFSPFFSIERAHRVPFKVLQQGKYPRPMLLKLLNYTDKMSMLQKAREMGDITYNGVRISIYPDFSPDLQKRRAEFIPIKKSLQKYRITYALLYQARLRVAALGRTIFFNDPTKVSNWLEANKSAL